MKIGVLGTGTVGNAIGSKLIQLEHEVKMGSRTADNEKAAEWVLNNGALASQGTFADAASAGEIIFNCTLGGVSLEVMQMAGADNLKGKIIIDISNPLDFSKGFPPTLYPDLSNTTSVGEEIQRQYPTTKVVKTLNTVNAMLMVNPVALADADHSMFLCGNDADAKNTVKDILQKWFGWKDVIDLGDISNARGIEMILPLWVRLYGSLQHPNFNFKIVR
ncbi:MAG: NAD(P)-binding domain-containing protein [Fimbriimonadaceae bacterium]|nr:NAD(P)-binding domain-containing protein [Chitinophagales bacterium]